LKKKNLILYIATSLDGYIAAPGDDLGFLDRVSRKGEDYGYVDFINGIDTEILGRKTYEWVVNQVGKYESEGRKIYVITHREMAAEGNIEFYNGDLKELVVKLKAQNGKDIFCNGGAEIVHQLLSFLLIDEIIVSVVPVLLGGGTPLFHEGRTMQELDLLGTKSYESGLVQLHYRTIGE